MSLLAVLKVRVPVCHFTDAGVYKCIIMLNQMVDNKF